MNASAAEPWARLGIVQGQSPRDRWELAATRGPTMIVVGASSSCSWVVQGAGVAPLHFSLYWDGRTLRISRSPGAPEVHVDGEVVWHAWRVLGGPARIQFGEAAIMVETSAGAAAQASAQAPSEPKPPPVTGQATLSAANPLPQNAAPTPTLAASSPAARAPASATPTPATPTPAARAPASAAPTPARTPVSATPTPVARLAASPSQAERTRAPKQTLVGMAYVSTPPPGESAPAPQASAPNAQPSATGHEAERPSTPAAARETLPGPGATPRRTGSLAAGDQRTMQGYTTPHPQPPVTVSVGGSSSSVPPARRDTLRDATRPDGTRPTPAPGRPISDRPLATNLSRTWEAPSPSYEDEGAPTEIMDMSAAAPHAMQLREAPPHEDPYRAQPIPISPAPAELRGVTAPISHRPRRPFPWQYVLVGVLTVVAYFAWLYLLDHF